MVMHFYRHAVPVLLPALCLLLVAGCSDDDDGRPISRVSDRLPAAVRRVIPELEAAMRSGRTPLPDDLTTGEVANPMAQQDHSHTRRYAVSGAGTHAGTVEEVIETEQFATDADGAAAWSLVVTDASSPQRVFVDAAAEHRTPLLRWLDLPYGSREFITDTGRAFVVLESTTHSALARRFANDPPDGTGSLVAFGSVQPPSEGLLKWTRQYRVQWLLCFDIAGDAARLVAWCPLSEALTVDGTTPVSPAVIQPTARSGGTPALSNSTANVLGLGPDAGALVAGTAMATVEGTASGGIDGTFDYGSYWPHTFIGQTSLARETGGWDAPTVFDVTYSLAHNDEVGDGVQQVGFVALECEASAPRPELDHPCILLESTLYATSVTRSEKAGVILFW